MSIQAISLVWRRGPDDAFDRLVLLALADHANAGCDTMEAWPSMANLVDKTRLSERSVRRSMRRLEREGFVVTTRQGKGRGFVNSYTLHIPAERTSAKPEDSVSIEKGATVAGQKGATVAGQKGATQSEKGATQSEKGATVADRTVMNQKEPEGVEPEETPHPSLSEAYVPTEQEILAFAAAWPGCPAMGAPAGMPMIWARDWYARQLGRTFFPHRWGQVMELAFKSDFQMRNKKAIGLNGAGPTTNGAAIAKGIGTTFGTESATEATLAWHRVQCLNRLPPNPPATTTRTQ